MTCGKGQCALSQRLQVAITLTSVVALMMKKTLHVLEYFKGAKDNVYGILLEATEAFGQIPKFKNHKKVSARGLPLQDARVNALGALIAKSVERWRIKFQLIADMLCLTIMSGLFTLEIGLKGRKEINYA